VVALTIGYHGSPGCTRSQNLANDWADDQQPRINVLLRPASTRQHIVTPARHPDAA
jgi:hypothetical protein